MPDIQTYVMYVCIYVYIIYGASTHKHVCTEVRIDLCAEIEFSASFFLIFLSTLRRN